MWINIIPLCIGILLQNLLFSPNVFIKWYFYSERCEQDVRIALNCFQSYEFQFESDYKSLKRHIEKKHPVAFEYDHSQTQILWFMSFGRGNDSNLFKYYDVDFREHLAKFIIVEHLSLVLVIN